MDAHKTALNFEDIPDRVFIPALKVRDIVRAKPLSLAEKKQIPRGSADILIKPLIGNEYLLSRNDVVNNFTYTNGSIIKTSGWESSKMYVIFRPDNTLVYAMQVPTNHTVVINGEMANKNSRKAGDYIVCASNESGVIDRSTAVILSAAVFRKMCYIPRQDIITKHQGSTNKFFDFVAKTTSTVNFVDRKNNPINPLRKMPVPNAGVGQSINMPNTTPVMNKTNLPGALGGDTSKFTVVGQVHDAYGKRIGFIIQAHNGATKQITKESAIKLATNKKLINAEAVPNPAGETYIRGNGVRLDDLPITYK